MPLNPYEELRVPKDASSADIKKAYRKRVREVHPDKHPDDPHAVAKTQQVQEAYEILSDTKRRKAYDTDGIITPKRPANLDALAREIIVREFTKLAPKLADTGGDIIASVRTVVGDLVAQHEKSLSAGNKVLNHIFKLRWRYKCKKGDDIFKWALDTQEADVKRQIEAVEHNRDVANLAYNILGDFEDVTDITSASTKPSTTTHWILDYQ